MLDKIMKYNCSSFLLSNLKMFISVKSIIIMIENKPTFLLILIKLIKEQNSFTRYKIVYFFVLHFSFFSKLILFLMK